MSIRDKADSVEKRLVFESEKSPETLGEAGDCQVITF
jgi:hypothetical protein